MKPLPTLMRPLRSVDLATGDPGEALVERSDVAALEALAVVAEAAVAWELARAAKDKFGGDALVDFVGAWRAYLEIKPELGVPSLYYADHLDVTGERLAARQARLDAVGDPDPPTALGHQSCQEAADEPSADSHANGHRRRADRTLGRRPRLRWSGRRRGAGGHRRPPACPRRWSAGVRE
jgi:hypothetical protein